MYNIPPMFKYSLVLFASHILKAKSFESILSIRAIDII